MAGAGWEELLGGAGLAVVIHLIKDWKRRIWKMRSSVAGEYTIKVLCNKWVLQTADRPRDVTLVEAAEELTAVCNTPSFYSYLLYPGYQSLEYSIEP